jgi:hypothetical protein
MTEFKTYLDTVGRPTLILSKDNVVRHHQQHFQVAYRFAKASILREPLLISAAVLALLLIVIAFQHADLRITEDGAAGDAANSVRASPVRSKRTGTALGHSVQEVLEGLLARPNGLLHVAQERSSAKQSLVSSLIKETTAALAELQKEEGAFSQTVQHLTTKINELQKHSKQYVTATVSAEVAAARTALATAVDSIREHAHKLANI